MTSEIYTGYFPRAWQDKVSNALLLFRFAVLVVHRRGGKTVLAVAILVDAALRDASGKGRYAYVAPYLKQAKQITWDYLVAFTAGIPGAKKNESELSITFPNGSKIRLYGADNADSMRGLYFMGVILDEYADMRPHVWGEVLRPTLSDYKGWAIFIGTPKGINAFYELFHKAQSGELGTDWYSTTLLPDDTDALEPEEIELARRTMSEQQFRQEFLCDWNASTDNTLLPIDVVIDATRRGRHLTAGHLEGLPKILGVDVARFGADRSSIIRRWGPQAFTPKVYDNVDNMELVGHVGQEIIDFGKEGAGAPVDAVFIDAGRGEGVIDRLTQLGHTVIAVEFGGKATSARHANKRTEMYDTMAEWLRTEGCIPNDQALVSDLAAPTYSFDASNRMLLEPKDKMKERGLKSPDVSDSLACTFAFPVAARGSHNLRGSRIQQYSDGGRYERRRSQ